jgi:O-antigen/teichoic acid export membrane protein
LLVVRTTGDVTRVALVNIGAEALLVTILVVVSRRRFGPWRLQLIRADLRRLFTAALPLTLMRSARTVMLTVDIVLVQLLRTSRELGYYAAASRVVAAGIVYLGLYYNAFLPTVVHARREGREALVGVVHAATRRALILGVPVAALATVIAPTGVRIVFGSTYEPAVGLLQVMIWALPLLAVTGVYSQVLVAGHAQRPLAVAVIVAMVVNLGANLILLPTVGTVGASIATVLGELTSLAIILPIARHVIAGTPSASATESA